MEGVKWDDEITWDDDAKPEVSLPRLSALDRFGRGLRDPLDAGAQLLTHALPKGAVDAGNRFNNWLVDKGVPLERIPEAGLDASLQEQEKAYQAQRAAQGETGIDFARLGGNVLSPANLAIASKIPQAATLAGRVGVGVAAGTGMGMLQPVYEGDFVTEKAKQAGVGALAGGVVPAVTGTAARVIRPNVSPEVDLLTKEGVRPTIGQHLGGFAKGVEEKATSIPFIGDSIKAGQRAGIEQFNRAGINRILKPLGQTLPKSVSVGRDALSYALQQTDDAYNKIIPQLNGRIDKPLLSDIGKIRQVAKSLPAEQRDQFENILQREFFDRFTKKGLASGETLKVVESQLGGISRGLRSNQDYDKRKLGEAVGELQSSMRKMLMRQNSKGNYATLKSVNDAYANLLRMERAAGSVGASDGVITPAQLLNATKALDPRMHKRDFATGNALMQDLAEAGKSVLSPTIPNSGTIDRGMIPAMLASPVNAGKAAIGGLLGFGLNSGPGRSATNLLLNRRPQSAAELAKLVRQSSIYLTPGAIPAAYGLLNAPPQ